MADDEKIMFMLGEIKGELKGINSKLDKVDQMDNRLRGVQIDAAKKGAVAGGASGVGIILIIEGIKAFFKSQHGT